MTSPVEAGLRRHDIVTLLALAVLVLLAWGWLLAGAGMGQMTTMEGMMGGEMAMPPAGWSTTSFALAFAMWWTMMVAMMLPSAAPTVLLYSRAAGQSVSIRPSIEAFLMGYLLIWGAFSLLAAGLQTVLEQALIVSPMAMTITDNRLTGALLVAIGLYQLTPMKGACLRHCRNPAQFLSRHYRAGRTGALRMGMIHGAYCVGCCWLLMALLLVGGVMNLAWIAILTLLVAAEKLLPWGRSIAIATGLSCLAGGAALLLAQ